MREHTDAEIEARLQALGAERLAIIEEAGPWRAELDRRTELERWAQRYAEAGERERETMLEPLSPEDRADVIARSEKWAKHAQTIALEPPAPPIRRRWWALP